MLEQLFGSKTRLKLLQLFINHPGKYYFVRELTRALDTQINAIRRELQNLESLGLVASFGDLPEILVAPRVGQGKEKKKASSAQKKYFKLNEEFILYPELQALITKEQLLVEDNLFKAIKKLGDIQYLVLTGLFVGLRDIIGTDLLVVGNVNKLRLDKLVKELEVKMNNEINYTVLTPTEFLYRKNINDYFIISILSNRKIVGVDLMPTDK